jgi:hypothetical protein
MYYGPKHDNQMKNWHFMHNKLDKFVDYYDENNFCLIGFKTFITWNPSFYFIICKYNDKNLLIL